MTDATSERDRALRILRSTRPTSVGERDHAAEVIARAFDRHAEELRTTVAREREACIATVQQLRDGSDPRATERFVAFDEALDTLRARGSSGAAPVPADRLSAADLDAIEDVYRQGSEAHAAGDTARREVMSARLVAYVPALIREARRASAPAPTEEPALCPECHAPMTPCKCGWTICKGPIVWPVPTDKDSDQ